MPPQASYLQFLNLQKTLPNAKDPFLYIPSLLQKYKTKNQLYQIHAHMTTTGFIQHPPLASKLVASFALNPFPGTTSIAHSIADRVDGLDTYTWNTVIRGYLEGNDHLIAISVFNHVRRKGLKVDSYTLLYVVKACGFVPLVLEGLQIHCLIHKLGFVSETIIQTALLHMYALFDHLSSAQQVFDETPDRDLIMLNVLISVYVQGNNAEKALDISRVMVRDGVTLNGVTALSILSACSSLSALREGKAVHGYIVKNLIDTDVKVCNALIDMYSRFGSLSYARGVFRRMPTRSVVSWTSIINGCSNNNCPSEALALFKEMEDGDNVKPDEITMLGVVSMGSKLGSFELGEWIDHYVEEKGFGKGSIVMGNALIDMHAKCGNIKKACLVFDGMVEKTLVSWSSMIQGLAMHGHGIEALVRFSQMQKEGLKPDGVVFISVLSACSHAGLVDEGRKCFNSMINEYLIEPWMEHYGCMVDLLCRAGLLDEAFEFVENMPIEPDIIVGRILLRACQSKGNVSLASKVIDHLCNSRSKKTEDYVLLANLYATIAEWDNVDEVRKEMREMGVQKQDPGCSFIG